jgi:hypothetical protein
MSGEPLGIALSDVVLFWVTLINVGEFLHFAFLQRVVGLWGSDGCRL